MRLIRQIVTPEFASEILANHNGINRKARKPVYLKYASDMKTGRWNTNSDLVDPISFANDGTLLNGQHRLYAVKEAKIPVEMWVALDCDKEIFQYFDCGIARSASDQLRGIVKNEHSIVGVGRFALSITEHGIPLRLAIIKPGRTGSKMRESIHSTRNEVVEYCINHDNELQEIYKEAARFSQAGGLKRGVTYAMAGVVARYLGLGNEYSMFVEEICSPISYVDIAQLCKTILAKAEIRNKGSINKEYIVGTILMAFDAYYYGRTIVRINKQDEYIQKYGELCKAKYLKEKGGADNG